ncbi:collagen alpha-1(XIV) chain-like [Epinephelus fuscoguttatus]|uniref:collagen alpha-1(XIV) chain-like n=1 Tax=Epinephelus fuscoguttatus TaxID=293821 RepID=UPI0020D1BF11|nr:collagen alpha-1(XIV) chain-like [Epinephelus fuscoguttatus]
MTGLALDYILHINFQSKVGMRADSQKIAVLITDGKSQDDIFLPSQNLKNAGIEIYAIGVKNADKNQLRSIASDPDEIHMYIVKDFSSLKDIVDGFTINICNSANSLVFARLVNGTGLCSGRLEVKSNQSNQSWSSVCEDDFDQQDAEVVCRSWAVGLLQSSRGRSMENWRLQCGPKSSSVEVTSLLSWTVEAQTLIITPAHLAKLLDSPAQTLSGWWEDPVAVVERWR